jgi:mitogen-activated protein kinase kinase kinase 1
MFSWGRKKSSSAASPSSSSGRRGGADGSMESSSRSGGDRSGSGSRGRSPQLDRRNAVKHIEYEVRGAEVSASAGASWSSSSLAEQRSPGMRPSRSLDLAPGPPGFDFRISGSAEGEVDELCRSLGLSGPEDFAIPLDAWEARKSRSNSDLLPRPPAPPAADQLTPVRSVSAPEAQLQPPFSVPAPIPEEPLHSSSTSTATEPAEDPTVVPPKADPAVAFAAPAAVLPLPSPRRGGGEVGIRGTRPPVLSRPPPPVLSPPPAITTLAPPPARRSFVANNITGSAWDIVQSFAPREDKNELGQANERDASHTSDTEEEDEAEDELAVVAGQLKEMRIGETFEGFTGCSSLSTTNDDDASSTTTEAMFIISPNGKFKRKIKSWMRGALLGSGSFGMVYEGISE